MTAPPTPSISARCVACGAAIEAFRERFVPLPNGRAVITERGELALRVVAEGACLVCGGDEIEVRVATLS